MWLCRLVGCLVGCAGLEWCRRWRGPVQARSWTRSGCGCLSRTRSDGGRCCTQSPKTSGGTSPTWLACCSRSAATTARPLRRQTASWAHASAHCWMPPPRSKSRALPGTCRLSPSAPMICAAGAASLHCTPPCRMHVRRTCAAPVEHSSLPGTGVNTLACPLDCSHMTALYDWASWPYTYLFDIQHSMRSCPLGVMADSRSSHEHPPCC